MTWELSEDSLEILGCSKGMPKRNRFVGDEYHCVLHGAKLIQALTVVARGDSFLGVNTRSHIWSGSVMMAVRGSNGYIGSQYTTDMSPLSCTPASFSVQRCMAVA